MRACRARTPLRSASRPLKSLLGASKESWGLILQSRGIGTKLSGNSLGQRTLVYVDFGRRKMRRPVFLEVVGFGMLKAILAPVAAAILLSAVVAAPEILGQSQFNASARSEDDLVPIKENDVWGYADKDGKLVIKPQFSRADRFSEGLALVWTGGVPLTDPVVKSFVRMGYIDKTGRWIIHSRFKYYFFDDFSGGLVPFRQHSSKWGYMDTTGKIVIRPRFDWAGAFSEGTAAVLLDGRCAHVDRTGKITDQSQTVLPRQKHEQDRHGTYLFKPNSAPCS